MSELKLKVKNFWNSLRQNGIGTEVRRAVNYAKYKKTVLDEYEEWILLNEPNAKELEMQGQYKSLSNNKFLILVPNEYAKKNIGKQTYRNYEVVVCPLEEYINQIQKTDCDYCVFVGDGIQFQTFALYELSTFVDFNECNLIYSDNDWLQEEKRTNPEFKPHFAEDTILSKNYIGNWIACKTQFLKKYEEHFKGISKSEPVYDMILRCMELTSKIKHINKILYHKLEEQIDSEEQKNIIKAHLERIHIQYDSIEDGKFRGQYKINYTILNQDKISIVIPNMDHKKDLEKCINSILKSSYPNYEVIIVENNSKEEETFQYYQELESKYNHIKVEKFEISGFNFSKIVNFGVEKAQGKYVLLLNNDIEILTTDWLEQMLMYVQKENVGICGALLYFDDDSIQHAGVTIGIRGLAGHRYRELKKSEFSEKDQVSYVQDLSAVTAACFMVKKADYEQVLGFDEKLAVAFNDVDFCLKIRQAKKKIIYNPFIEAYHYESKSRGEDTQSQEKQERFAREYGIFVKRWSKAIAKGDYYFNINYRLDTDIPKINYNKIPNK